MSILTASRRKARTESLPSTDATPSAGPSEPVLFQLIKAMEALSRISAGGTPPPGLIGDESSSRDEDDDHVYLWVNIPDYRGPDIDINLHAGTLMIRFEKPGDET